MTFKLIAAAVALTGLALGAIDASSVQAADLDRPAAKKRTYHHRAPARRYAIEVDPYHYSYEPRGYYPFYRAGYWRPAGYVRQRSRQHYNVWNTQPPYFQYYKSWGYPVRHWHHKEWHAWAHGRHRPWHW